MIWTFFNKILVINLPDRRDRLEDFWEECDKLDIRKVEIINGIREPNPVLGFNHAQHNALQAAEGNTLILEDDVIFKDYDHLEQALNELPANWDLCYLGANVVGTDLCRWPVPEKYSAHLRTVKQAWTTHAIAYSQAGRDKILAGWNFKESQIFDDYLRCNLENLNAFIVDPMVADQRKGFSDIWNRNVDYGFFNVWEQKR